MMQLPTPPIDSFNKSGFDLNSYLYQIVSSLNLYMQSNDTSGIWITTNIRAELTNVPISAETSGIAVILGNDIYHFYMLIGSDGSFYVGVMGYRDNQITWYQK